MITKKKVDLYLEIALSKFKWVSRNADNLFFKLYMATITLKCPSGRFAFQIILVQLAPNTSNDDELYCSLINLR